MHLYGLGRGFLLIGLLRLFCLDIGLLGLGRVVLTNCDRTCESRHPQPGQHGRRKADDTRWRSALLHLSFGFDD